MHLTLPNRRAAPVEGGHWLWRKATSVGALPSRRACTRRICIATFEMGGRLFPSAGIGCGRPSNFHRILFRQSGDQPTFSGAVGKGHSRLSWLPQEVQLTWPFFAFSAIRGKEEKPQAGKARIFCE